MDRDAVANRLRRAYAYARISRDQALCAGLPFEAAADAVLEHIEALAHDLFGPSFAFEPDMSRTTDATPARMSGLRPVPGKDLPPPGPNCACHECVRSRCEGRAPNSLQHYGRVGRVQGLEGKETLVNLRAIPGGARPEERPSARYIDEPEAG